MADEALLNQYQSKIDSLCLMDDNFMQIVFNEDIEATEAVVRILLEDQTIKVTEVKGQYPLKSTSLKSIRLDIHAKEKSGDEIDCEIQRDPRGAKPTRARYNSALMDSNMISDGQDTDELHKSFVIFITENDYFGSGRPLYHINRKIEELGNMSFDDGSHIIYANGTYAGNDDIGKLMHDLKCTDAKDMLIPVLADRVHYYKETEGGRDKMCKAFEEVKQEGKKEGKEENKIETATNMLKKGFDHETVAECSMLSIEKVEELARSLTA